MTQGDNYRLGYTEIPVDQSLGINLADRAFHAAANLTVYGVPLHRIVPEVPEYRWTLGHQPSELVGFNMLAAWMGGTELRPCAAVYVRPASETTGWVWKVVFTYIEDRMGFPEMGINTYSAALDTFEMFLNPENNVAELLGVPEYAVAD